MYFEGGVCRTEGYTCSIIITFTCPVTGQAYNTCWEGLPLHAKWMCAGVRHLRMLLGPLPVTLMHTAPPAGARPWVGPLAVIPWLLLVPRLRLVMVVRISCYHLLMANMTPLLLAPTGMGPNLAAPPSFVNSPPAAGKRNERHAVTARA